MRIRWTAKAVADLARLHDFLAAVDAEAAAKTVQSLSRAPPRLLEFPRLGERLIGFDPREVRRLLIGRYEMRYELRDQDIFILRIWCGHESR